MPKSTRRNLKAATSLASLMQSCNEPGLLPITNFRSSTGTPLPKKNSIGAFQEPSLRRRQSSQFFEGLHKKLERQSAISLIPKNRICGEKKTSKSKRSGDPSRKPKLESSNLDGNYSKIASSLLNMMPKLCSKKTGKLDPFSPETGESWEQRGDEDPLLDFYLPSQCMAAPYSGSSFLNSAKHSCLVWECHCLSTTHCQLGAPLKITVRFVCLPGGETRFHRRSALLKLPPCKSMTVHVWKARITKTENTRHATVLVGSQLFLIKVCHLFWTTKDVLSNGSFKRKENVFHNQ